MVLVRLKPGREEKAAFCHDTVNNCKINYTIYIKIWKFFIEKHKYRESSIIHDPEIPWNIGDISEFYGKVKKSLKTFN